MPAWFVALLIVIGLLIIAGLGVGLAYYASGNFGTSG